MESSADGASSRQLRRFRRARNSGTLVDQVGNPSHLFHKHPQSRYTQNHYRCLLAITLVIASKTGRRIAEGIAHSGLLFRRIASIRANIEPLCPSSRSLHIETRQGSLRSLGNRPGHHTLLQGACPSPARAGSSALRASDKPVAGVSKTRRRPPTMRRRSNPPRAPGNPFNGPRERERRRDGGPRSRSGD